MTVKTPAQPKSARLWTRVRQDILDGRLKPGDVLPTQRELGKRHGVAEATAALALSRLVQEGLVFRKRGKGTYVTHRRSVATRRIDFVRISEDPGTLPSASTLQNIEICNRLTRDMGCRCDWHYHRLMDLRQPEPLLKRFEDAAAVIGFSVPAAFPRALFDRGIPVLSVLPRYDEGVQPQRFTQLDINRRDISHMAVEHLLTIGCKRIAYVGRGQVSPRAAGFIEAARRFKLQLPLEWVVEGTDLYLLDVMDRIRGIMQRPDRPDGFVAMTDRDGAVVQSILRQMGLDVPRDVALVAGDVGPDAEHAAITTVGPDWRQSLSEAIEAVLTVEPGFDPEQSPPRDPVQVPLYVTQRASSLKREEAPMTK